MNKAVRGIASGVVAAVLALAGCSSPPGAAAQVNGVSVPDTAVRHAASVVSAQLGIAESGVLPQVALDMTLGEASTQIAARNDIQVSDARIQETLRSVDPRLLPLAEMPGSDAWVRSAATTYVVVQEMGRERYTEQLRELPIRVNPRYGTWDAANVDLVDGSLSQLPSTTVR